MVVQPWDGTLAFLGFAIESLEPAGGIIAAMKFCGEFARSFAVFHCSEIIARGVRRRESSRGSRGALLRSKVTRTHEVVRDSRGPQVAFSTWGFVFSPKVASAKRWGTLRFARCDKTGVRYRSIGSRNQEENENNSAAHPPGSG